MTLDAILAKIRSDAESEAKRILKEAGNESVRIRHRFAQELKKKEEIEHSRYNERLTELRNINLAQAHRNARQIKLHSEEELIEQCFSEIEARLGDISGSEYNNSLKTSIIEGLKLLGGNVKIRAVRESDLQTIEQIIKELEPSQKVKVEIDQALLPASELGGINMISGDGKKIVDNTFRSILERKREQFRIDIARILFG
jgi:vacuolar-type H+-ATPase subunit E/Vma4